MKRYYPIAILCIMALAIPLGAYADDDDDDDDNRRNVAGLVRMSITAEGSRAVGVFADCGRKLAAEECNFTVQSVRYTTAGTAAASTKFDALCIDIGFPDGTAADAWNCSPVTIEPLAVSVDAGAAGAVVANGGINIGSTSAVGTNGQVHLGLGVALPISRRLEVPMAEHVSSGKPPVRLGGNVLIESGIGPVFAGQTVVFGHTPFDGVVTFLVEIPKGMTLTAGQVSGHGESVCAEMGQGSTGCPAALNRALQSACEISTGGPCGGDTQDSVAPMTAFGPQVDTAELRAFMTKLHDTMATVNTDLQERLPEKLDEVFALLDADEDDNGGDGGTAAALPRLRVFQKVKTHFQNKVLPKLNEIKETVQKNVLCPS
jgi:hypothetical protein